jgi:hypothetical protein
MQGMNNVITEMQFRTLTQLNFDTSFKQFKISVHEHVNLNIYVWVLKIKWPLCLNTKP